MWPSCSEGCLPHHLRCHACSAGTPDGRVEKEFSKVFRPEQCSLQMLDPVHFDAALAGKRLIMFGDSIMRIQWLSLACLLRSQVISASMKAVLQGNLPGVMQSHPEQWSPSHTGRVLNFRADNARKCLVMSGDRVSASSDSRWPASYTAGWTSPDIIPVGLLSCPEMCMLYPFAA